MFVLFAQNEKFGLFAVRPVRCLACSLFGLFAQNELIGHNELFGLFAVQAVRSVCCSGCSSNFEFFALKNYYTLNGKLLSVVGLSIFSTLTFPIP